MSLRTRTPPGRVYGDPTLHERLVEAAFVSAWHPGPDRAAFDRDPVVPWVLAPGTLDEPLVTVTDASSFVTLSNVCTHRGARLVSAPCSAAKLRCSYHGRRFLRDGRLDAAPGVDPLPDDADLPRVATEALGPLLVARLAARGGPVASSFGAEAERLAFLFEQAFTASPDDDRVYEIDANWMLYLENYLEGLHVPFVHPALNAALDLDGYEVTPMPGGVLQVGEAKDGNAFALPPGHPDAHRAIAAYYVCLFPGLIYNFYPWGLSLNVIEPLGPRRTRVVYRTWITDPAARGRGAGGDVGATEREDQAVIALVQSGVRARLYGSGRYILPAERGVAWFHQWLDARLMADGGAGLDG